LDGNATRHLNFYFKYTTNRYGDKFRENIGESKAVKMVLRLAEESIKVTKTAQFIYLGVRSFLMTFSLIGPR